MKKLLFFPGEDVLLKPKLVTDSRNLLLDRLGYRHTFVLPLLPDIPLFLPCCEDMICTRGLGGVTDLAENFTSLLPCQFLPQEVACIYGDEEMAQVVWPRLPYRILSYQHLAVGPILQRGTPQP